MADSLERLFNGAAIALGGGLLTVLAIAIAPVYPPALRSYNTVVRTMMCINVLLMATATLAYGLIGAVVFVSTSVVLVLLSPFIFWNDISCALIGNTIALMFELMTIVSIHVLDSWIRLDVWPLR